LESTFRITKFDVNVEIQETSVIKEQFSRVLIAHAHSMVLSM